MGLPRREPLGDPCPLDVQLADAGLRLLEVENRDAIGIGLVIGRGDRLDLIGAIGDVPAHDPSAAILTLSIANVQARVDRPVIGFPGCRECQPPRPRPKICIPYRASHPASPLAAVHFGNGLSNTCLIYVVGRR